MKAIIAIVVIAIVGIAAWLLISGTLVQLPSGGPSTGVTADESILYDELNSLTDQQLAEISTDLTDYSTSTQDDIAGDTSLFVYQ